MESVATKMTDSELIAELRRLGTIWFSNRDLLKLEELIRRFNAKFKGPPIK